MLAFWHERPAPRMWALVAMVAFLTVSAAEVRADQPGAAGGEESAPVGLRITDGRVSGNFRDRPLSEFLDVFSDELEFTYDGYPELLAHPVSNGFNDVPLMKALTWVLEPFNHVAIHEEAAEIRSLKKTSLRSHAPRLSALHPAPLKPAAPGDSGGTSVDGDEAPPNDITAGMDEVPPELNDMFYPWQEPGTELSGPAPDYDPYDDEFALGYARSERLVTFYAGIDAEINLTGSPDAAASHHVEIMPVPVELYEHFYPEQEPGTEATGPVPDSASGSDPYGELMQTTEVPAEFHDLYDLEQDPGTELTGPVAPSE